MLCLQQRWADLAGAINTKHHCRDFSHEPKAGSDADRTDEELLPECLTADGWRAEVAGRRDAKN